MRPAPLIFALAFASACGGETSSTNKGGGSGTPSTSCAPCMQALVTVTNGCAATVDACTNNRMNDTATQIACFQDDARCYQAALTDSAACQKRCGDDEQANVETCTGVCYRGRGDCAQRALLETDACLDRCSGANCATCSINGRAAFSRCDADLSACAENCKRVHRSGG